MLTFVNKLPDFNPVNANGRPAVRVPTGPTYREFSLHYAEDGTPANEATMIAGIEQVSIKIGGIVRWSCSGAWLVALNKYYNYGFTDGQLIIPLSRPWARTMQGEENLAWGTRNVSNMHIEVKLAAGVTNPTLSADALVTPESRDLGMIVEVHETPFEAISAGKKEIPDLAKENGALLAVHLKSDDITALEIKMNKVPFIENDIDLASYQRLLERIGGRVAQTGYVHADAMLLNRIDDAWPLAGLQTFNVNPTVSQAGSIPILMETLNDPLGTVKAA
ncbi:MAG: major capsid protein P2 [Alphaproteobacteria bacterium]